MPAETDLECVDAPNEDYWETGPCKGTVDMHPALSGSGNAYPYCGRHYDAYRVRMEKVNSRWPVTDQAPPWFNPTLAGEIWHENDAY